MRSQNLKYLSFVNHVVSLNVVYFLMVYMIEYIVIGWSYPCSNISNVA